MVDFVQTDGFADVERHFTALEKVVYPTRRADNDVDAFLKLFHLVCLRLAAAAKSDAELETRFFAQRAIELRKCLLGKARQFLHYRPQRRPLEKNTPPGQADLRTKSPSASTPPLLRTETTEAHRPKACRNGEEKSPPSRSHTELQGCTASGWKLAS